MRNCSLELLKRYTYPQMQSIRRGSSSVICRSLLAKPFASQYHRPRQQIYTDTPRYSRHQVFVGRQFHTRQLLRQEAALAAAQEQEESIEQDGNHSATSHGPVTKFQELAAHGMVCPTIIKTLTSDMGLDTMTDVQRLTINETLKGADT